MIDELIAALLMGIGKALQAPAEERAQIIAAEVAAHAGALEGLQVLLAGGQALDASRALLAAALKSQSEKHEAELARLRATVATIPSPGTP